MRPPQGVRPSPFVVRKRIAIAQRLRCSFAFRQWLAQTPAPPSQGARRAFRCAPRPPCPLLPCAPQRGAPCNDTPRPALAREQVCVPLRSPPPCPLLPCVPPKGGLPKMILSKKKFPKTRLAAVFLQTVFFRSCSVAQANRPAKLTA